MDRHLAGAVTAKLADDQRPGLHHPLDQRCAHRRTTGVPKITKLSTLSSHEHPESRKTHGIRELNITQTNCVHAVAAWGGPNPSVFYDVASRSAVPTLMTENVSKRVGDVPLFVEIRLTAIANSTLCSRGL